MIEEGKKFGTYEVIKKTINNILKYQMKTMLSYCLKYNKKLKSINLKVLKTNNGKTMIFSKCAICGSKKSRFIQKKEAGGILKNLGLKTPLNKIPLLVDILF